MKTSIWVEKYRPKTISEVIFQDDRQGKSFETFVKNQDIPNLLLSGSRGTGKTSVSKALIRDLNVDLSDVLKINCSKDKVDAMRSEVDVFAMTMPMGKFKIVQLEELDGMSHEGQKLLRSTIEDTSASCRFIATCNYANKILPPLEDRFQHFYFRAPDKERIAIRMADILEREKVDFDIDNLLTYIDVGYPSIRQIIQLLHQNSQDGALLPPRSATSSVAEWKFGLLDMITSGNFRAARKLVCESATRDEHVEIFTFLYQNIEKLKVKDKDAALIEIAAHARHHTLVDDTELNLAALFIELGKLA